MPGYNAMGRVGVKLNLQKLNKKQSSKDMKIISDEQEVVTPKLPMLPT